MAEKSINQIVSESLAHLMGVRNMTAKRLGELAGVSPRTVGNFLNPTNRAPGSKGKEPGGKLTELDRIARALQVSVAELVTDLSPEAREANRRMTIAAQVLATGEAPAQYLPRPTQARNERTPLGESKPQTPANPSERNLAA